jgi:competence protein ComEA
VLEQSRSTIAIWAVAAAVAAFAAVRLLGGGGGAAAPPVRIDGGTGAGGGSVSGAGASGGPAAGTAGAAEPSATGASGGELYVHVAGAVRRAGLIRVPRGARVATALARAGGATRRADLTLVNLAARVQDGQQIVVPVVAPGGGGAAAAGGAGAGGSAALPAVKIHLSTATVDQLDEIDGIGPGLAGRIVQYRDSHGGFRSLDGLAEVEGLGEKRLATLRDALQP